MKNESPAPAGVSAEPTMTFPETDETPETPNHLRFTGFLRDTRIGTRIWALVGIGAIGIFGTGAVATITQSTIERNQQVFDSVAQIGNLNDRLKIVSLQMRRSEKDFLIRRDAKYRDKYLAAAAQARSTVETMRESAVAQPLDGALNALSSGLDAHIAQFETVFNHRTALGFDEKTGLQGKLRKAVHGVESRLKTANLNELTVKMLMMRRHEKDFILRGAAKYIDRIDKRQAEFRPLLAGSPLPADMQAEINKLLDSYVADFKLFAAESTAMQAETKKLSTIFAGMGPSFGKVDEFVKDELAAAHANLEAAKSRLLLMMFAIAGVVLLLSIATGYVIARSISGPVRQFSGVITELAEGNTELQIDGKEFRDEIGTMARSLDTFRENLRNAAKEREANARAMHAEEQKREAERRKAEDAAAEEQRETEARAAEERKQTMLQMAADFESRVMGVVTTVTSATEQMRSSATKMSESAENTHRQAASVAAGAEEATANVQTVATATEELSASVEEINRQAEHSNSIAQNAVADAKRTNEKVESLASDAQKIGDVVNLINDIASQTNLLALNATIEAARAGEAGKGFAVVATEVKSLADQTAKATDEIGTQIGSIQEATTDAVKSIQEIGTTISEIGEIAGSVVAAVEEQGAATREIAVNVQQAATGTQDVSSTIAEVTEAASESQLASRQILEASAQLADEGQALRAEVQKFLESVRAA